VTSRQIAIPVDDGLAQAATALASAPPGTDEEWSLPPGDHALGSAVTIDVAGRSVRLRGDDACRLVFATGGLTLHGVRVEVTGVAIEAADAAAALRIDATEIVVADLEAKAAGNAAVLAIDLDATETIDIEDLLVTGVTGDDVCGVRARGGAVRLTGVAVRAIAGTNATGLRIGSLSEAEIVEVEIADVTATATGTGAMLAALTRIEVARLTVDHVRGADIIGIAVVAFGQRTDDLSAVDLTASRLTATVRATGIVVGGRRDLTVRGFTASEITAPAATGMIVVGGGARVLPAPGVRRRDDAEVEVGFGQISRVVGTAGDAAGLRLIAMPSARQLIVRDVAVTEVAGAPVPSDSVPPRDRDDRPAWQTWGAAFLADLDDDAIARETPPPPPAVTDVVGLAITAVVDDVEPFLDQIEAGDLAVIDSSVRVVSGSAVQIEGALRPIWLRRLEVTTAVLAGYVQADRLLIANTTWDRLGSPLVLGAGEIVACDSIFSRITSSASPVTLDADVDWVESSNQAVYADRESPGFRAFGALPYMTPGAPALPPALLAGSLPPDEPLDLRFVPGTPLHATAVEPPPDDLDLTDDERLFVGAHPPEVPAMCDLYDPERPIVGAAVAAKLPDPVVDYRARDARSLLAVMLGRAQQVMQPWTERGPADLTTMLFETVAERLDHLAYQQERAVAEGFLDDARLRRSVEDHVRPLDYQVDPGLSATAMLRFRIDLGAIAEVMLARQVEANRPTDPGLDAETRARIEAHKAFLSSTLPALEALADDGALEIPAKTIAANDRNDERVIAFVTEEPLAYFPALDELELDEDIPAGATSALLKAPPHATAAGGRGVLPQLAVGRWLVLWRGVGRGGHVVRVTTIERGSDVVEIGWDPRRPMPWPLSKHATSEAPAGVVLGNVTPAHHGFPLAAVPSDDRTDELARYAEHLEIVVEGEPGIEVPVPFAPISVHAPGYPLPADPPRRGQPQIRVLVDDDEWRRTDDLAVAGPGDEVFAVRSSADGRPTLRFGDGVSGSALPGRGTRLQLDVTVGCGREGNVGERILTRLLEVPVDRSRGPITGWLFRESMETLRGIVQVDNPIPAVEGRDREPIDRIRYRAPLLASRPLSAVTPEDYERVARQLPEVAGAHARVVRGPVRPAIRVTVLLRDEDTLDPDERLRRWALVRSALERARLLGFDVESVPPIWAPLDLDVIVDAHPHAEAGTVRDAVIAAVSGNGGLLDPDTTGLGGDVQLADLYRSVLAAQGVAAARVRRFRRLRQHAPERLHAGFIQIAPEEVAVVRGPARPAADGVLTVTVCGGLR